MKEEMKVVIPNDPYMQNSAICPNDPSSSYSYSSDIMFCREL